MLLATQSTHEKCLYLPLTVADKYLLTSQKCYWQAAHISADALLERIRTGEVNPRCLSVYSYILLRIHIRALSSATDRLRQIHLTNHEKSIKRSGKEKIYIYAQIIREAKLGEYLFFVSMLSVSSTSKQASSLCRKSLNLCEIAAEYPIVHQASTERHVFTGTSPARTVEGRIAPRLPNLLNIEHRDRQGKDTKKHDQCEKEEIEVIELFPSEHKERDDEKLYRKRRYRTTTTPDQPPIGEQSDATDWCFLVFDVEK